MTSKLDIAALVALAAACWLLAIMAVIVGHPVDAFVFCLFGLISTVLALDSIAEAIINFLCKVIGWPAG